MKHSLEDTIAAIVTPIGIGGVGVVRLSGSASLSILHKIFSTANKLEQIDSHRVYHGWIVNPFNNTKIDEVLAVYMQNPKSYTGEDVVEISGHGGSMALKKILDLVIYAGARLAGRGEFSKRAFLNGKIDLLQAEAVIDLISSKTDRGYEAAVIQLEGKLSSKIKELRSELMGLLAHIEAEIDFNDDVESENPEVLLDKLIQRKTQIDDLLSGADEGRLLREGVKIAIVGKPNVGKSSLLNALVGRDRAIVTTDPGTTRDTIEEVVSYKGVPLVFTDTAGLRTANDKAEELGIKRAFDEIAQADIILVVLDASQGLTNEDRLILEQTQEKTRLLVLNKIDLGRRAVIPKESNWEIEASALKLEGIEALKLAILNKMGIKESLEAETRAYINNRHKEALLRAGDSLQKAIESIRGEFALDLVAIDLRYAIIALGEISGEEVSEEVIDTIFERFCVGK